MRTIVWKILPLLMGGWLGAQPMLAAAPPDYTPWQTLLTKHYDPARGMRYRALRDQDKPALDRLRLQLAQVDPAGLAPKDRLAYWINLYNVSVVATVVDNYPIASIRDLSTDPFVRLNVFKKDTIAVRGGMISLDTTQIIAPPAKPSPMRCMAYRMRR